MATMAPKFPTEKLMLVKSQLEKLDDNKLLHVQSISYKDPTLLIIISLLFGSLGIDRFMLGDTGLGIVKLLTCGGFGIWTIIDWFTVMQRTRELNYQKFAEVAGY